MMDIFYNLLHLIGDPFGMMDPMTSNRTSGLVITIKPGGGKVRIISDYAGNALGKLSSDDNLPSNAQRFKENHFKGTTIRWSKKIFTDRYYEDAKKAGSLLGFGFLPWSNKLIKVGDGEYRWISHENDRDEKSWRDGLDPNGWAGQNLNYKIQTIAILGFSFLVFYYGLPILLNRII